MIIKIIKLKNFGIFYDFLWRNEIPEFKRFNLIYGWNRSGKTTLSRLLTACEKKSTIFKQYPENGEFEIKTADNLDIKNSDLTNSNLFIKVFNRDFIDENISFDPSGPCNPIVYVSEEDIESKKKLDALKEDNKNLVSNFEKAQQEKAKSEKEEENFQIATAHNIKTTIGNLKVRDRYYDYNKSSIKAALDKVGIDNFIKSTVEEFDKYKEIINSVKKDKQSIFTKYELSFLFNKQNIEGFNDVYTALEPLLSKNVISETLERLKNDQDLTNWVKQGYDLHKSKNETKKCLFCQNPLQSGFLESLSKHFSKGYVDLQNSIEILILELKKLKKEKVAETNTTLYFDMQKEYQQQAKNLNNIINELNECLDGVIDILQKKSKNLLTPINPPKKPKDFQTPYNKIVDELNEIIKKHNTKVDNYDNEVKSAKGTLEHHLIAEAIEQQGYKKMKNNLTDALEKEKVAKDKLDKNHKEIKTLEHKTSNIGKAIEEINKHLEEFFGRKEIQLELDVSKKGYIIKRDGGLASNLSEGEKTAIAFSYFIVKAHEKDFKIREGIIFIDDPVSSLDSNFIYHCFSLIKNKFNNAGQLFVSTHNFELFNLVKTWFLIKNRSNKEACEFYMIETIVTNNKRHAYLKSLEETLKNFKSEYHFLFSRLKNFVDNPTPKYADFYTIGNIARRFLEIFTNFKIPTTGDLLSKIGQLESGSVTDTEKDRVYKLIQEFSHGSDPVSIIEHKDKSECQEAIKILLNIVKESDPKHFELLSKNS